MSILESKDNTIYFLLIKIVWFKATLFKKAKLKWTILSDRNVFLNVIFIFK